jgi:hypothetical protein
VREVAAAQPEPMRWPSSTYGTSWDVRLPDLVTVFPREASLVDGGQGPDMSRYRGAARVHASDETSTVPFPLAGGLDGYAAMRGIAAIIGCDPVVGVVPRAGSRSFRLRADHGVPFLLSSDRRKTWVKVWAPIFTTWR